MKNQILSENEFQVKNDDKFGQLMAQKNGTCKFNGYKKGVQYNVLQCTVYTVISDVQPYR